MNQEIDVKRESTIEQPEIRSLTKHEIDERMRTLADEVFSCSNAPEQLFQEPLRPRWITAAELVERVRPFIVHN